MWDVISKSRFLIKKKKKFFCKKGGKLLPGNPFNLTMFLARMSFLFFPLSLETLQLVIKCYESCFTISFNVK